MDKLLLNNTLKHVTIHNKLKEEDYCWKEYYSGDKERRHRKSHYRRSRSPKKRSSHCIEKSQLIEQELSRQLNRTLKKSEYIENRIDSINKTPPINFAGMTAIDWWRSLAANEQNKTNDKWHHDGFESLVSGTEPIENNFRKRVLSSESESSKSSVASDRKALTPPCEKKKKKKKSSKIKKKKSKKRQKKPLSSSASEVEWIPKNEIEKTNESVRNENPDNSRVTAPAENEKIYDFELPPAPVIEISENSPASSLKSNNSLCGRYSNKSTNSKLTDPELLEEFQGGKLMEIKSKRFPIDSISGIFKNKQGSISDQSSSLDFEDNQPNGWRKPHSKLYIPKSSNKRKKKKKKSKGSRKERERSPTSRSSSRERPRTQSESISPVHIDKKKLISSYNDTFMRKEKNDPLNNVNEFWTHSGWDEIVKENPDDAEFKKKIDKKLKKEAKKKKNKKSKKSKK